MFVSSVRSVSLISICLGAFVFSASAVDELAVAREALRDGLWSVARTHAAMAPVGDASAQVIAESFAREGNWDGVLAAIPAVTTNEVFTYYRALALDGRHEREAARKLLAAHKFSDPELAALSSQLQSRMELVDAVPAAPAGGVIESLDDGKLLEAEIALSAGDRAAAERLWREALFSTNLTESALSTAAMRLGDVSEQQRVLKEVSSPTLRRRLALSLGTALLARDDKGDMEAAEKLIRDTVLDAPDTPGAQEAQLHLAAADFRRGDYEGALRLYDEALRIWPAVSRDYHLRFGRGSTLMKLNRLAESRAEFAQAAVFATNDESKASAKLQEGDCAAALGHQQEALEIYRNVLAAYPNTSSARALDSALTIKELENKGRELFAGLRFEEAEGVFAEVARLDESYAEAMDYRRAQCLYARGLDSEAEAVMRRLADEGTASSQTRLDAGLWLAKLLYNRGQRDESRQRFLAFADNRAADPAKAADALLWAARCAFVTGDFDGTVKLVTRLAEVFPDSASVPAALLLQAEALLELARFDEAILVLKLPALTERADPALQFRARMKNADALFAMGADNPNRYREALEAYGKLRQGDVRDESTKLVLSYKVARTLDKLRKLDEAIACYYTDVLLAYRNGRLSGVRYSDEARAAFSRAGLRLADEYEGRGRQMQARNVLELIASSDVPAAVEAKNRIERLKKKGSIL